MALNLLLDVESVEMSIPVEEEPAMRGSLGHYRGQPVAIPGLLGHILTLYKLSDVGPKLLNLISTLRKSYYSC